jgi:transcription elongation factor Elf1
MKDWKHFEDNCPRCGNEAEIYTSAPDGYAYDGDLAQCVECGLEGGVMVDDGNDDGIDTAYIDWNDYED